VECVVLVRLQPTTRTCDGDLQDRGGGHGKDRDQRMPAAAAPSRVVDRCEVGQQVWGFGRLQGVSVGEPGEGGWEGG
jgi:hypothetical protein